METRAKARVLTSLRQEELILPGIEKLGYSRLKLPLYIVLRPLYILKTLLQPKG